MVVEIFLERVDGQQSEVGLLLCIAEEVDVGELADFEVVGGDVLDDLRKVL